MAIDNWLNLDLIVANKKEADSLAEQNSMFSIFFDSWADCQIVNYSLLAKGLVF